MNYGLQFVKRVKSSAVDNMIRVCIKVIFFFLFFLNLTMTRFTFCIFWKYATWWYTIWLGFYLPFSFFLYLFKLSNKVLWTKKKRCTKKVFQLGQLYLLHTRVLKKTIWRKKFVYIDYVYIDNERKFWHFIQNNYDRYEFCFGNFWKSDQVKSSNFLPNVL